MISFIGESKREKSNYIIRKKLNKQKTIYTLLILALPLIFLSLQRGWIPSPEMAEVISGDRMATCKLTIDGQPGNGSAFLVSKNGLLVTARHCVADNPDVEYTINFDKVKSSAYHNLKASVVFLPEDENDDYAVLKLKTPISNIEPLRIAEEVEDPALYNPEVTIIGYPAIVKSQSIDIKNAVFNYSLDEDSTLFMIDEIYPGYSGGPVIDKKTGEVIGICSWKVKANDDEFWSKYVGMSFCEKIQQVFNDPGTSHLNW